LVLTPSISLLDQNLRWWNLAEAVAASLLGPVG
jgi:hypothetical protein